MRRQCVRQHDHRHGRAQPPQRPRRNRHIEGRRRRRHLCRPQRRGGRPDRRARGQGSDTIRTTITNYVLPAEVENIRLDGVADIDAKGNAGGNSLFGNEGDNLLDGGAGADRMNGGDGNDIFIVDDLGDRAIETSAAGGNDRVESSVRFFLGDNVEDLRLTGDASVNGAGNELDNRITGNFGSNTLVGRDGEDSLNGSDGSDRLFGGDGSDNLRGGAGADRFYFDSALDAGDNVDRILDFSAGDDRIMLDRSVFSGIEDNGRLAADAFHEGVVAQDAQDRILYDEGSGRIFYDADGAGGVEAVLFARVEAGLDLANTDFSAYI